MGSFEKGLRVLKAFSAEAPSMTLSEVAAHTELTRAAARRFLHTLVELGYAKTDGKQFQLTPRVLELGYAYLSSLGLSDVLTPHLQEVSRKLEESSSASVLDGDDIVYVARVQASRIMSVQLGVGAKLPALQTSMGRVLAAFLAAEECEALVETASLQPLTPKTITDPNQLRDVLRDVRRNEYCLVDQELELGLLALAVPVKAQNGRVVAAMNVSAHASRVSAEKMEESYLPVLVEAAREAGFGLV